MATLCNACRTSGPFREDFRWDIHAIRRTNFIESDYEDAFDFHLTYEHLHASARGGCWVCAVLQQQVEADESRGLVYSPHNRSGHFVKYLVMGVDHFRLFYYFWYGAEPDRGANPDGGVGFAVLPAYGGFAEIDTFTIDTLTISVRRRGIVRQLRTHRQHRCCSDLESCKQVDP